MIVDREEALRDDFHFDSTYDYGEDEEWADEEANWTGDEGAAEPQEGGGQLKDESAAYLEFLNDEVSWNGRLLATIVTLG